MERSLTVARFLNVASGYILWSEESVTNPRVVVLLQEAQIWQTVAGENQVRFRLDRLSTRTKIFGASCVAY